MSSTADLRASLLAELFGEIKCTFARSKCQLARPPSSPSRREGCGAARIMPLTNGISSRLPCSPQVRPADKRFQPASLLL